VKEREGDGMKGGRQSEREGVEVAKEMMSGTRRMRRIG